MQVLAKRLKAQRLHVIFKVGIRLIGVRAGEGAQLTWSHAHRTRAFQQVFQPILAFPTRELANVFSVLTPLTL